MAQGSPEAGRLPGDTVPVLHVIGVRPLPGHRRPHSPAVASAVRAPFRMGEGRYSAPPEWSLLGRRVWTPTPRGAGQVFSKAPRQGNLNHTGASSLGKPLHKPARRRAPC